MPRLILSRLLQGLIVLLVVSMLTFALLAAAGGDALTELRADPLVSEATINQLRHVYGLDEPLPVRYARWLGHLLKGDLGQSIFYRAPVASLIAPRLFNTLKLAALAFIIACAIAFTLGALSARRRGSWLDRASSIIILLASSTPRIVLALVALVLILRTSLFNIGASSIGMSTALSHLLVPALVLAVPLVALFLAQTREGLAAALRAEFVQVARAKGLTERVVILRHALRAALNPLITIFGYSIGSLLSGSVIVETVMGWPGLGSVSVVAVRRRDVPLLMGLVLITATAVLVCNLLADIALRYNDPRLREEEARAETFRNASQSLDAK